VSSLLNKSKISGSATAQDGEIKPKEEAEKNKDGYPACGKLFSCVYFGKIVRGRGLISLLFPPLRFWPLLH